MIKYKIADNAMAKLALPLTETSTTMTIKEAVNIPTEGIWIATLVGYEGEKATKMEKVRVNSRSGDVLTIERGFESHPLQWEADTPIFLNVTAEVIRDIQDAIEQIGDTNNLLKKTNNLSDLQDKAQARTNLGAESERNKKQSIEANKTSNTFYPTIKAVYDWVTSLLGGKADLIDGKVPAEQLPEVQAIDESNLVHKSGDEEIRGKKIFSGGIALSNGKIYLRTHGDNNHYIAFDGSGGNGGDGARIHELGGLTFSTSVGDAVKIKQDRSLELCSNMIIPQNASIFVGGNDILGERQSWTPTNGSNTITIHHCRYKKIGKTCHFIAQVYVNNVVGNTPGFTLPIPRANYLTEFVVAGYCVKRGENPATQSRGAISFSGQDRVFTLGSTDVSAFTQPGEYIIRASGIYETE